MCKTGGPRCPSSARGLLKTATEAMLADPTPENRTAFHQRLYDYRLTRTGLDEFKQEVALLKKNKTVPASAITEMENQIEDLEWERGGLLRREEAEAKFADYVADMTKDYPEAPVVAEALLREGAPLPRPYEYEVKRWSKVKKGREVLPYTGAQMYAMQNLLRRCRYEEMINSVDAETLEPPGSQAMLYPRDENGRISQVYYASYGSNMRRSRFMAYIAGGKPEGASRTYRGARDNTEPLDDIAIKYNHPVLFASKSKVWGGGIAFLDATVKGSSLGRAYLITSDQFDDVVAQEGGGQPDGKHQVDLDAAVTNRVHLDDPSNKYGTLVHVGDHNGRPVVTFTTHLGIADAMDGDEWIGSGPKGIGSSFYGNAPSASYMRMIGEGLKETFGIEPKDQSHYIVGCYGGNDLSTSKAAIMIQPPPPPKAAATPSTASIASSTSHLSTIEVDDQWDFITKKQQDARNKKLQDSAARFKEATTRRKYPYAPREDVEEVAEEQPKKSSSDDGYFSAEKYGTEHAQAMTDLYETTNMTREEIIKGYYETGEWSD